MVNLFGHNKAIKPIEPHSVDTSPPVPVNDSESVTLLSLRVLEERVPCHDNEFLELAVEKLGLSTRAHHKLLKIARTLADMEGEQNILHQHMIEALSYRAMDKILRHLTEQVAI